MFFQVFVYQKIKKCNPFDFPPFSRTFAPGAQKNLTGFKNLLGFVIPISCVSTLFSVVLLAESVWA
jgi:hypothetical protein